MKRSLAGSNRFFAPAQNDNADGKFNNPAPFEEGKGDVNLRLAKLELYFAFYLLAYIFLTYGPVKSTCPFKFTSTQLWLDLITTVVNMSHISD